MTRSWELIKSPRHGSSVGVHSVRKPEELAPAIAGAAKSDCESLIERFVSGRELTINIPGEHALPILEIISKGGFYNFANKYPFPHRQADDGAEHVCPVGMDEKIAEIQDLALQASLLPEAAGVAGFGYTDLCAMATTGRHAPKQKAKDEF